jgi:hypothetical protein
MISRNSAKFKNFSYEISQYSETINFEFREDPSVVLYGCLYCTSLPQVFNIIGCLLSLVLIGIRKVSIPYLLWSHGIRVLWYSGIPTEHQRVRILCATCFSLNKMSFIDQIE